MRAAGPPLAVKRRLAQTKNRVRKALNATAISRSEGIIEGMRGRASRIFAPRRECIIR